MSVLRLTENVKMDRGDRFILFYGNVNDEFCEDGLILWNIDLMLWRFFTDHGYRRIVFFDGADKITFYDHESRSLCIHGEKPMKKSEGEGSSSLKGPLGRRNLLQLNTAERSDHSSPSEADTADLKSSVQGGAAQKQRRMSDLSALEILNFIIQGDNASIPTVVIFPMAEDIRNFQGNSLRELQNRMMKWVKGSSQKPNKCVFIFQQSTIEEVKEIVKAYELHIVANFIEEKNNDSPNLVKVGFPDKDEITNLVHLHRLNNQLQIDWRNLDKITEFLVKQRLSLKALNSMISGVRKLNKDTLLDWNKTKSIRSTEYLIEKLEKDGDFLDPTGIKKKLSQIYCQEDNISQLIDLLEVWYPQIEKKSPLTFFLVGTSGVGKTYTAELLGESLQPLGYEYCYFAMTEFQQEHTVSNLIGSPKGYRGSEEEPKLFEALNRSKKKLVICFDEIEKAHDKIHKALMQLLDRGYLSWSKGEGDFRECIILFTSNAQKEKLVKLKATYREKGNPTDGPDFTGAVRDILVKSQGMPPEVCRRINKFLVYNPLTPEAVLKITHQEVGILAKSYGLEAVYTAPEFLAEMAVIAAGSDYGIASIKEHISLKIGKALSTVKREDPDIIKVIIRKSREGYAAVSVGDLSSITSIEEMIDESIRIYRKRKVEVSFLDTSTIQKKLGKIYCQEDNISQLIDLLEVWYPQIEKKSPLTFFLVGTSGVGKTYTAELLGESLQPLGYEYCYFAMTEFQQEHTVSNLIGSPKGYRGSEEEPKLFEALNRSKKKLVICFDEIEKAHDKIYKALMQLLDRGYLSWSKGEGDFRECIILFTSNAQKEKLVKLKATYREKGNPTDGPDFTGAVRDILVKSQGMPPEVCRRINKFLVYNPLTPEAVLKITHQEVGILAKSYGLEAVYTAPEFLAEMAVIAAGSDYGIASIKEHISLKIGKALSTVKREDPDIIKVIIKKSEEDYLAVPVSGINTVFTYEEMIEMAKTLLFDSKKTNTQNIIAGRDIKPKRLLKLHELPTSLPKKRAPASTVNNPLADILPAVGYVEVRENDGGVSSGSGFVITPDGKFVTSYHVIEKAQSIRIRFENRPGEWFKAGFVDGDREADIALLKVLGNNLPYILLAHYGDKVELGENVGLLGYPLGDGLGSRVTYTAGVISSFRQREGGASLYQIDANAYHGSSGGPLVRLQDGRIIGVLMGGWKKAVQINFAVSVNEIYKRLVSEY
ncbi:AAA family ATPase [Dethiobacter alkaliphilus]|uniref:AAA family ATPase n=1 Tax=Dethiobacter alkaliphilus TaxID=427926 RepID=UPI0022270A23|nr:AAA family ATPase [Dethiobacter alkaliphilus]MCW3488691.1 AAA family ATPase [Dethiobacter alkaliphilus]